MTRARLVLVLLFACSLCGIVSADYYSPRQYYSNWSSHPTRSYHYRYLYYKPTPNYVGYKHHYCLYYRSRPNYVYFYNPYKKTYWGRCAVNHGGKYSMLAEADRKSSLDQIPESAFPQPGDPPPLPEAEDDISLDLPPDDLPIN